MKLAKRGKLINRKRRSAAEVSTERVAEKGRKARAQAAIEKQGIDWCAMQTLANNYCEETGHYVPAHRTCDPQVVCKNGSSHWWRFRRK